jgi:hypothetical protein
MAAALLVFSYVQILKWQQPPEATVAKTCLLVSIWQPPSKHSFIFPNDPLNFVSESTCNLHNCKTCNLIEQHGGKL